ncbi:unnamed protein product [Cylicostephanus goldi]|uniref:SAYSvFN domain-containing protein n=1 Tax=Cylicostephanus goldi TaxID=71465 RepID=A0A3P7QMH1_CYLGO|nr:unnamed protein product [Cylicostephanus goldi]
MSILIAICLGLGNRSEGESAFDGMSSNVLHDQMFLEVICTPSSLFQLSAYSVFNPHCERLLGQMTAEHFERDVLRRRID